MKILSRALIFAMLLWGVSASAEYCKYDDAGILRSCTYNAVEGLKGTRFVVSYTRQGWALTVAIYVEEFVMLEGDARVKIRGHEEQTIEYVSTTRDIAPDDLVMEAAVFKVSEELLLQLADASGKVKFYVPALEAEELEIRVQSVQFKELADYVAETKAAVGL